MFRAWENPEYLLSRSSWCSRKSRSATSLEESCPWALLSRLALGGLYLAPPLDWSTLHRKNRRNSLLECKKQHQLISLDWVAPCLVPRHRKKDEKQLSKGRELTGLWSRRNWCTLLGLWEKRCSGFNTVQYSKSFMSKTLPNHFFSRLLTRLKTTLVLMTDSHSCKITNIPT